MTNKLYSSTPIFLPPPRRGPRSIHLLFLIFSTVLPFSSIPAIKKGYLRFDLSRVEKWRILRLKVFHRLTIHPSDV